MFKLETSWCVSRFPRRRFQKNKSQQVVHLNPLLIWPQVPLHSYELPIKRSGENGRIEFILESHAQRPIDRCRHGPVPHKLLSRSHTSAHWHYELPLQHNFLVVLLLYLSLHRIPLFPNTVSPVDFVCTLRPFCRYSCSHLHTDHLMQCISWLSHQLIGAVSLLSSWYLNQSQGISNRDSCLHT